VFRSAVTLFICYVTNYLVRLVVVELVDAYGREHRVEDRELPRGESSDPARGGVFGSSAAMAWIGRGEAYMMHRAPRPCVASLTKPISDAMVLMRENMDPDGHFEFWSLRAFVLSGVS
jgi:hypothetical protein